ncbi:MAG TPA: hypothetical protein VFS62_12795 [Chloroflexota bacterium]|jgi:hypothetical protein|nr:hypothetical protein [Chloroflexota bacterium]
MFFRRPAPPEPPLASEPPRLDQSMRRQGAVETLNLIAHSTAEAVTAARTEADPAQPDNFIAGQLMAYGQILSCIERERDMLLQQLVQDAGLHAAPAEPVWEAELTLLRQLPLSSEELFRLAMDFRKMEEPPAAEPEAEPTAPAEAPGPAESPAEEEAAEPAPA